MYSRSFSLRNIFKSLKKSWPALGRPDLKFDFNENSFIQITLAKVRLVIYFSIKAIYLFHFFCLTSFTWDYFFRVCKSNNNNNNKKRKNEQTNDKRKIKKKNCKLWSQVSISPTAYFGEMRSDQLFLCCCCSNKTWIFSNCKNEVKHKK